MTAFQNCGGAFERGRALGTDQLNGLDGWVLPRLAKLELAAPGLLLHLLSAPPSYRQAVFLSIGMEPHGDTDRFLTRANGSLPQLLSLEEADKEISLALRALSSRGVLRCALGLVPTGLHGALAKLGPQPLRSPDCYGRLYRTIQGDQLRAKVLMQVGRLDSDLLDAVQELDPVALIPGLVQRVGSAAMARRLNQCLHAIRVVCSGATDEALRQSLDARKESFRLQEFANAWSEKADRLGDISPALQAAPDFERVTGRNAKVVGAEFDNCLGRKIADLTSGVWSAWIWRPARLIATILRCDEGPLLVGIFAQSNGPALPEHADQLRARLKDLGVSCFKRSSPSAEVGLLTRRGFLDLDFDEFDFE